MSLAQNLWDYAVSRYGRPGVADACLTIQRDFGADIPMVLYAGWMGGRGRVLESRDIAQIDETLGEWRGEVIVPLRAMRTRMKSGPFPAPSPATSSLRDKIKAAELAAEKIELDVLEERFGTLGEPGHETARAVRCNLDAALTYFSGADLPAILPEDVVKLREALGASGL